MSGIVPEDDTDPPDTDEPSYYPPDASENVVDKFRRFIDEHEWTFAKTMAEGSPHEYVHRDQCRDEAEETLFEAFIAFIREEGYDEMYYGDQYTCFDIDGYKYWTMGIPVDETTILNRRSYDGYDIIGELEAMGEDPSEYVDVTNYERGELYGAAERTYEDDGDEK